MASHASKAYLIPGRLEDVLALIQVLALAPQVWRNEGGLKDDLQGGDPTSLGAATWLEVARQHREFFRVTDAKVSLLSRHVTGSVEGERTLKPEFVQTLFETAVKIHDTQLQRRRLRTLLWTGLGGILLSSTFSAVSLLLTFLKK